MGSRNPTKDFYGCPNCTFWWHAEGSSEHKCSEHPRAKAIGDTASQERTCQRKKDIVDHVHNEADMVTGMFEYKSLCGGGVQRV